MGFTYTHYFEQKVLRKRPYLRKEWCEWVVRNAEYSEPQPPDRHRFWARVDALGGRYLRVVTLGDRCTIHDAFPDRSFRP